MVTRSVILRLRLPRRIKVNVEACRVKGHRMVSQGAAMFRCTGCDARQFLDVVPAGVLAERCVAEPQLESSRPWPSTSNS